MEIKPLMNALQDFFEAVLPQDEVSDKISVVDAGPIHNEIFKIHFLAGEGEFTLNRKADSFEVYDFLMTCMHTWLQASTGAKKPEIEPEWEKSVKVAMLSSISCDRNLTTPCFIHEVYYL